MTEQEAIDALEEHKKLIDKEYLKTRNSKAIEVVLNALKEKDKTIDLMSEWIEKHTKYYDEDGCYCEIEKDICNKNIECEYCIKQYFENKVKE